MHDLPLVMPKMSMTMTEGTFLVWHKKEGDVIRNGDVVCEVASDKVDMEVESPLDGTLGALLAQPDDVITVGAPLAYISTDSEDVLAGLFDDNSGAEASEVPVEAAAELEPTATGGSVALMAATPPSRRGPQPAVPYARRRASELRVDLREVIGSGPGGVVTVGDVETAAQSTTTTASAPATTSPPVVEAASPLVEAASPPAEATPPPAPSRSTAAAGTGFEHLGPVSVEPLSRVARVAGPALTASWTSIPHVTHHDHADITDLDAYRRQVDSETGDCRVTLLAFVIAAATRSLRAHPRVNSSLAADGTSLVLKQYCNIGVAVDTDRGLVVPVIRNADRKGVLELSRELAELSHRARENSLSGDDVSGACFTISSLGGIGGTAFTPIVNAPEVAILGVSRSSTDPVWNGEVFEPRLRLPLSLSYDHRVVDGALGARFTAHLALLLGDVRRLVL